MNLDIEKILSYFDFLAKEQELKISIHGPVSYRTGFARFGSHAHPLCIHIKNEGCQNRCVHYQEKLAMQCENNEPFFDICYAGIGQYVYPIFCKDELQGFICVSGYDQYGSPLILGTDDSVNANSLPYHKISLQQNDLRDTATCSRLESIVFPLIYMLQSLCRYNPNDSSQDTPISKILQYIHECYNTPLNVKILSKQFNYSISTISHMFKKETGMSLPQYIENLRIENAKIMLKQGNKSVTEIATELGFSDTAYFCNVFKKNTGKTPKQYMDTNITKV